VDLTRPGVSSVDVAPGNDGLGPNPSEDGAAAHRRRALPRIIVTGGKD
jgi:hypothetical protein